MSLYEPPRDTCYRGTALIVTAVFSQSERTTFLGAGRVWDENILVSLKAGARSLLWFLLCGAVVFLAVAPGEFKH